jgi:hypothetical protein
MGRPYRLQRTCLHQIWKVHDHTPLLILTNFLKLLTKWFNKLPVNHLWDMWKIRLCKSATSQTDIIRRVFCFFFQSNTWGKAQLSVLHSSNGSTQRTQLIPSKMFELSLLEKIHPLFIIPPLLVVWWPTKSQINASVTLHREACHPQPSSDPVTHFIFQFPFKIYNTVEFGEIPKGFRTYGNSSQDLYKFSSYIYLRPKQKHINSKLPIISCGI